MVVQMYQQMLIPIIVLLLALLLIGVSMIIGYLIQLFRTKVQEAAETLIHQEW